MISQQQRTKCPRSISTACHTVPCRTIKSRYTCHSFSTTSRGKLSFLSFNTPVLERDKGTKLGLFASSALLYRQSRYLPSAYAAGSGSFPLPRMAGPSLAWLHNQRSPFILPVTNETQAPYTQSRKLGASVSAYIPKKKREKPCPMMLKRQRKKRPDPNKLFPSRLS